MPPMRLSYISWCRARWKAAAPRKFASLAHTESGNPQGLIGQPLSVQSYAGRCGTVTGVASQAQQAQQCSGVQVVSLTDGSSSSMESISSAAAGTRVPGP
jgi:hypothetical protein